MSRGYPRALGAAQKFAAAAGELLEAMTEHGPLDIDAALTLVLHGTDSLIRIHDRKAEEPLRRAISDWFRENDHG